MPTYDLTGAGEQTLTAGTTRLFIDLIVVPVGRTIGIATPRNYYHVGELRIGVDGYYLPVHYVDADHMLIELPDGATTLGYGLVEDAEILVGEEGAPGPPPSGHTVWPDTKTPATTFTNVAEGMLGNTFSIETAGPQLVGVRYYRPPADTATTALHMGLWRTDTGVLVAEWPGLSPASGWNTFTITAVTLIESVVYNLAYQVQVGWVRCADSGAWGGTDATPISTYDGRFLDTTTFEQPTSGAGGDWLGVDVVVTWP